MNYENKYYKFKNKYLALKNKLNNNLLGGQDIDVTPIIVKNYDNQLDMYKINYNRHITDIVNEKETKSVYFTIQMTYTPNFNLQFSIDQGKNELELTVDLKNNSTSNVKIVGVFSAETQSVVRECLKKLLKASYLDRVSKQNDVLTFQNIIIEYRDETGKNPLIWIVEEY